MTKGELIQFLLPFDDDLRIVAQLASGEYVDLDAIAYLIDRDGEGFGVMCEGATLHWLRPRSAPETRVSHAVTCKKFPDPYDERDPTGPCTCRAEKRAST